MWKCSVEAVVGTVEFGVWNCVADLHHHSSHRFQATCIVTSLPGLPTRISCMKMHKVHTQHTSNSSRACRRTVRNYAIYFSSRITRLNINLICFQLPMKMLKFSAICHIPAWEFSLYILWAAVPFPFTAPYIKWMSISSALM